MARARARGSNQQQQKLENVEKKTRTPPRVRRKFRRISATTRNHSLCLLALFKVGSLDTELHGSMRLQEKERKYDHDTAR